MSLKIGDYVKFSEKVINNTAPGSNFLYGVVSGFRNVGNTVKVILPEEYHGFTNVVFPEYFAGKVSTEEYQNSLFVKPEFIVSETIISREQQESFMKNLSGFNVDLGGNSGCSHDWEQTYQNHNSGEWFYNCKHCEIAKEKI